MLILRSGMIIDHASTCIFSNNLMDHQSMKSFHAGKCGRSQIPRTSNYGCKSRSQKIKWCRSCGHLNRSGKIFTGTKRGDDTRSKPIAKAVPFFGAPFSQISLFPFHKIWCAFFASFGALFPNYCAQILGNQLQERSLRSFFRSLPLASAGIIWCIWTWNSRRDGCFVVNASTASFARHPANECRRIIPASASKW